MANYYISDLHLFCKSELWGGYFKERPFDTLDEMHDEIKRRWNSKVSNADHVYVLGDLSMRGYNDALCAYMSQLKGNLHWIVGNHDSPNDLRIRKQFVEVVPYKELSDNYGGSAYKVILFHYPIFAWNGQHRGAIHLYGHTHDNFDDDLYQEAITKLSEAFNKNRFQAYNVGCMHWNYEPVTLKEILERGTNIETEINKAHT